MILRRLPGLALGLFVLGQLLWLPAANSLALLPTLRRATGVGLGPLPPPLAFLAKGVHAWERGSGQPQRWRLFAPNVLDVVAFPVIEAQGADGNWRVLHSANEPRDPSSFFRLSGARLRRVETSLDIVPPPGSQPTGSVWGNAILERLRRQGPEYLAYLRWRTRDMVAPVEVVLSMRLLRIPPPPGPEPWHWADMGTFPVARWRPDRGAVLEAYDPVTGTFHDLEAP